MQPLPRRPGGEQGTNDGGRIVGAAVAFCAVVLLDINDCTGQCFHIFQEIIGRCPEITTTRSSGDSDDFRVRARVDQLIRARRTVVTNRDELAAIKPVHEANRWISIWWVGEDAVEHGIRAACAEGDGSMGSGPSGNTAIFDRNLASIVVIRDSDKLVGTDGGTAANRMRMGAKIDIRDPTALKIAVTDIDVTDSAVDRRTAVLKEAAIKIVIVLVVLQQRNTIGTVLKQAVAIHDFRRRSKLTGTRLDPGDPEVGERLILVADTGFEVGA